MVCTGEEEPEPEEHDELDVAVDADEERRSDVRMLLGEKRERIIWKREGCMLMMLMMLMLLMFGYESWVCFSLPFFFRGQVLSICNNALRMIVG